MFKLIAPNLQDVKIILASGSPRRKEILEMIHMPFEVIASTYEENRDFDKKDYGNRPEEYVLATAMGKAMQVAKDIPQNSGKINKTLVISCDTVCVFDNVIMEKPKDKVESMKMMKLLNNQTHQAYSGVVIVKCGPNDVKVMDSFVDCTNVTFGNNSDALINAYVESGEGLDKAASYGIQGAGGALISKIDGDFYTVMGLPLHMLTKRLSFIELD